MEKENIIQLSNLTIKHLLEEIRFLENGFINNVQSLQNGWLKIKVHAKGIGDKNLIITPNALFVSNYSLQAKKSPGGFSALLKKYLNNQRILSIKQHSVDRVIILEFAEVNVILELFAKGNIILTNKEMIIIKAMRKEEWRDRKLEQHEKYKFPASKGINPLEENQGDFEKKLLENKKTFFGACVDIINAPPQILEYLFDELKLDKKKNAVDATKKEAQLLLNKIKEVYSSKAIKVFVNDNVLYTTKIGKNKDKEFDNIQTALNSLLLSEEIKDNNPPSLEPNKVNKKNKHLMDIESKKRQVLELEVQEKELQSKGELIYLKYDKLNDLLRAIEKGKKIGLSEKEIIEKINSKKKLIKTLDFKKNSLVVEL